MKKLIKYLIYILFGKIYLWRLTSKNKKSVQILCPNAIGDICYTLAYLDELKKTSGKDVTVIININKKKMMEFYPQVNNVVGVKRTKLFDYIKMFYKGNANVINPSQYSSSIYKCDLHYLEINRDLAYKLSKESNITYPLINNKAVREIEEESVILNPYSNSVKLGLNYWNKIVNMLKKCGLKIYTNVTSTQKEIEGTKRLECSILEMYELSQKVKFVIGIRSGIMDFIVGSGTNMIVIYPKEVTNDVNIEKYSLKKWKAEGIIQELFDTDEEKIEKAIECFSKGEM